MDEIKHAPEVSEDELTGDNSFDRWRRLIGAVCAPLCALLVWYIDIPGLENNAHTLLAIMTLVALWWITEPVPIPVTSLIGPTLCVVFGVVSMKEAFAARSTASASQ